MTDTQKISQIKFDKNFLQNLLGKLTVGNGRSIHLNAVPGLLKTRIDLTDLSVCADKNDVATDFLDKLMTHDKFRFTIGWDDKSKSKMSDEEKESLQKLTRRLDAIVADNEDMYLETGIKNFGFGYPLLVKPDSKNARKIIVAPVFIWSLDIEKSSRKNEWIISKSEENPIKVNELLISHIENDAGIHINGLSSDVMDDNILSRDEIMDYLSNELFKKLNIGEKITEMSLDKCPKKNKLEDQTNTNPWIQWSGVFGLYRSQKEPIIEATRDIIKNIKAFENDKPEITPFQTITTASFDLDPSQGEIINTLNNDEFKVIQGPPGTGKSQAISAIISNALANGARTLVVCEKKTALDVLAQNLERAHLDSFCIVVDDVAKDRATVVRKARFLEENVDLGYEYIRGYDKDVFNLTYEKFKSVRDAVNGAFNESSRPIFAGKNWTDIVGEYLRYSKSEYFNAIKDKFGKLKIEYTSENYGEYLELVRQGAAMRQQVEGVNDRVFYLIDIKQFGDTVNIRERKDISEKISNATDILDRADEFLNKSSYTAGQYSIASNENDINRTIKLCADIEDVATGVKAAVKSATTAQTAREIYDLVTNFNAMCKKLPCETSPVEMSSNWVKVVSLANDIITQTDNAHTAYREGMELEIPEFDAKKTGFIKSLFSSSRSRAARYKRDIRSAFTATVALFEKLDTYTKVKHSLQDWDDYATLTDAVKAMDKACKHASEIIKKTWADMGDVTDAMATAVKQVKKYRADCESILACRKMIKDTDNALCAVFPRIAKLSGRYADVDSYKKTLADVRADIDALGDNLGKLGAYNSWIKFYAKNRYLLDLLMIAPVECWQDLFNGAFYYNFLLDFESNSVQGLPSNNIESKLTLLRNLYNDLQNQNVNKIHRYWYQRRMYAINDINNKWGYKALFALKKNQRFGKRLSLRQIIDMDFDNFTTLFPVIMVNPIVANALLPLRQGLFDIVIFDEASQLRLEDVFTAMIRGRYKIIAGDKHQMPPSNWFAAGIDGAANIQDQDDEEDIVSDKLAHDSMLSAESLLEFTEFLKDKNMSYLDFHYRSRHPALIEFSNAAFYGGNLCPLPVRGDEYTPIKFIDVAGLYTAGAENINRDEAAAVLDIISKIVPDEKGEYPSVGVATFNIHQRNLIINSLYERAHSDAKFDKKFEELRAKGLFVKNLENIQGDERDIIIISTTFGRDKSGRFVQNFGGISGQNGYKLLNVLVTRAKKQMYVVTSIPSSYYSKYDQEIIARGQNNGRGILYAYLAYAQAISENNVAAAESVLSCLRQFAYDKQNRYGTDIGLTDSVFEQEVLDEISKIINPKDIHPQYRVGGYRLDFRIDVNGHKIALECDGKKYHQSPQAYMSDMHRQKQIEQFGYKFYRIWSSDWFEDKNREVANFRRYIESLG